MWEGDREQLVHEFINPPQDVENPREAPSLSELKAEIQRYVEKVFVCKSSVFGISSFYNRTIFLFEFSMKLLDKLEIE